jgi:glutathione S-transferase
MTEAPYALYYWPSIPGRGEWVRLTFHLGGIAYADVARDEGAQAIMPFLKGERPGARPFAPPFVVRGEEVLWQTANICDVLARRHGLVSGTDAPRADQLLMTVMDLAAEAHDTHHPIATGLYFEDQQEAAEEAATAFRQERIPKFLDFFESHLEAGGGTLLGHELSHADVGLWHAHQGLLHAFPIAMASMVDRWPRIRALDEAVRAHEALAAYLASDERMPFNSDGIFRHYPALDAEVTSTGTS